MCFPTAIIHVLIEKICLNLHITNQSKFYMSMISRVLEKMGLVSHIVGIISHQYGEENPFTHGNQMWEAVRYGGHEKAGSVVIQYFTGTKTEPRFKLEA